MTHHLVRLARVSTNAQDAQLQRDALQAGGCIRIFVEKISSRSSHRPGLAAALDYMRDGTDTLVVWKLDRLGRSTKDILTVADDLSDRGIGLRVLTGTLAGTYSPGGGGEVLLHDDGRLRRARARPHPRTHHGGPGSRSSAGAHGWATSGDGP
ncbi:recombinase family protein [Georgenia sp. Marseille-Q6866]